MTDAQEDLSGGATGTDVGMDGSPSEDQDAELAPEDNQEAGMECSVEDVQVEESAAGADVDETGIFQQSEKMEAESADSLRKEMIEEAEPEDVPIKEEVEDPTLELPAVGGAVQILDYKDEDVPASLPVLASIYSLAEGAVHADLDLVPPKVEDDSQEEDTIEEVGKGGGIVVRPADPPIMPIRDGGNIMINVSELGTPIRKSKRAPKPNRKYTTDDESSSGEATKSTTAKLVKSPSKDQSHGSSRSKSNKIITIDLTSEFGQKILQAQGTKGKGQLAKKPSSEEQTRTRSTAHTNVESEDERESVSRSSPLKRGQTPKKASTHTPAGRRVPVKRAAEVLASSSGRVRKMPKYMRDYELATTKTVSDKTDSDSERTTSLVRHTSLEKPLSSDGDESMEKDDVPVSGDVAEDQDIDSNDEDGSGSDSTDSDGANADENIDETEDFSPESKKRTCLYCPFKFTKVRLFTQHCRDTHKDMIQQQPRGTIYHCMYCNYITTGIVKCQLHMTSKHRSRFTQEQLEAIFPFECPNKSTWDCKFRSFEERFLKLHLRKCNATRAADEGEFNSKGEKRKWRQSPSHISSPNHRSTRAAECHAECQGKKTHKCGLCSKTYPHHSVMVMHEAAHLISGEGITDKNGGHTCVECDKAFNSYHLLYAHMEVVHRGQEFRCPICNKLFTTKGYIRNHIESVHIGSRKHLCDTCGVSYKDSNTLRRHIKVNHPECADTLPQGTPRGRKPKVPWKRFMCHYCSMKFYTRAHCVAHQATHTGDKMYKCPVCDKLFAQEGTVHNHLYKFKVHKHVVRDGFRFPRQELLVKDGDLKMKPPIVLGSPSEGLTLGQMEGVDENDAENDAENHEDPTGDKENTETPSYLEVVWTVAQEDISAQVAASETDASVKDEEDGEVDESELVESMDVQPEEAAEEVTQANTDEAAGSVVTMDMDIPDEVEDQVVMAEVDQVEVGELVESNSQPEEDTSESQSVPSVSDSPEKVINEPTVADETLASTDQEYHVEVKDSEILITQGMSVMDSEVQEQPVTEQITSVGSGSGDLLLPPSGSISTPISAVVVATASSEVTLAGVTESKWSHLSGNNTDIIQKAVESISQPEEEPSDTPEDEDDLTPPFSVSISESPSTTVITVPPVIARRPVLQQPQPRAVLSPEPGQPRPQVYQSILKPRLPAASPTNRGVRPLTTQTFMPRSTPFRPQNVQTTVRTTKVQPQLITAQARPAAPQSVLPTTSDPITKYLSKPPPKQLPQVPGQIVKTVGLPATQVKSQQVKSLTVPMSQNIQRGVTKPGPLAVSTPVRPQRMSTPKPVQARALAPLRQPLRQPLVAAPRPLQARAPAPIRQTKMVPPPIQPALRPKLNTAPVQVPIGAPVQAPVQVPVQAPVAAVPAQPQMTEVLVKRDANHDPNEPLITEELLEQISKFVPAGQKFLIRTDDGSEIIVDPTSAEPEPEPQVVVETGIQEQPGEMVLPMDQDVTQQIVEQAEDGTTLMMTNDSTTQQELTVPQDGVVYTSADGGGGDGETVYVFTDGNDGVIGDQGNMMYVMQDSLESSNVIPTSFAGDSAGVEQQVVYMDASNFQMLDNGEMVFMQQVDQ